MLTLPNGLHGAFTRKQLSEHLGRKRLRAAIDEGRLVAWSREVLVARHLMLEFHTRCAAAQLIASPDGILARETALRLHGCTAVDTDDVHVLMPYGRQIRVRHGLIVHHGRFEPSDVVELNGLRCQALEAAITDVLCEGDRSAALAAADQLLASVPITERNELKGELGVRIAHRPSPHGRSRGQYLLDLATGLPESPPESWMLLKIADSGLPIPELQYEVRDLADRVVWRLDFAWPEARLALEYDGYEAHADRKDRDAARDEDLRRRGWTVIRADVADLRDPTRLLARLKVKLGGPERKTRGSRR